MPVLSCSKFGINQTILTVFSGVRAKKPPPPWLKKAENAVGNRVKVVVRACFEHTLLRMFLNIWSQILFPEDLHDDAL